MNKNCIVRIVETQIENFKNVSYGDVRFVNYSNVQYRGKIEREDINGIYGQNGSGKTAVVEVLDIIQHVLSGREINYNTYGGMFDKKTLVKLTTLFYIQCNEEVYKAQYKILLRQLAEEKKIQIDSEEITYWRKRKNWNAERKYQFSNPFYNMDNVIENITAKIKTLNQNTPELQILKNIQSLAIVCAQKNTSVFFNEIFMKLLSAQKLETIDEEERIFKKIIEELYNFAMLRFQVVKVNRLGANYDNQFIPVNIHEETENEILQGCLPLFVNGRGEFPEELYERLNKSVEAINTALTAIVPNLKIEMQKIEEETDKEGKKRIKAEVYSIRDGKKFLTKYESEGIKRIISLLNYLISLYNDERICLVVDELDAGIFEYLLGELVGLLADGAKGQLIFTSHNLRVLERLDKKNIICSTVNPNNRYISLKGIEKNHNKRDFYIRSVVLGGQKERLYDNSELQDMNYAFKKAGSIEKDDEKIDLPEELLQLLNESSLNE